MYGCRARVAPAALSHSTAHHLRYFTAVYRTFTGEAVVICSSLQSILVDAAVVDVAAFCSDNAVTFQCIFKYWCTHVTSRKILEIYHLNKVRFQHD